MVSNGVPVMHRLQTVFDNGGQVYYVVGNHDLVLEHFLDTILTFTLSPFLNVRSGRRPDPHRARAPLRPLLRRYPDLYELATHAGRAGALRADRRRVPLWTWLADRPTGADGRGRAMTSPPSSYCHGAAEMLLGRGFDAVLFGHTHNAEHVQMPSGTYVNCGNWLRGHTYVEIDHGKIDLKSWEG